MLLSDPRKIVVSKFSGINFLGRARRKSFLIDSLGKLKKIYNVGDLNIKRSKSHAEEVIEDIKEFMEMAC